MAEEFKLPIRALKGGTEPQHSQPSPPAPTAPPECPHTCPPWGSHAQRGDQQLPSVGELLRASPGQARRTLQLEERRRLPWFVCWCNTGAPQQPPEHVAGQNGPPSPAQLPLPSITTLQTPALCGTCPPPYHGNVVAGMEENGEVRLLQTFLQSFQALHHLISVIPGETWIRREQSVNSIPHTSHPKETSTYCREMGFT